MNDLQKCILDIYKEVKKICDKNNIPYYAIGGTCLGAVRHKGFIPWDDDLDLGLPIEYLDKFIECCDRELPKKYKIYSAENIVHYKDIHIKIIDTQTTFIRKYNHLFPEAYSGVWIDVISLTSLPDKKFNRRYYLFMSNIYRFLNFHRRFNEPCVEYKGKYRFIKKFLRPVLKTFFSVNYFYDKWLVLQRKNPFSSDTEYGMVVFDNLVFEKSYFKKIISFDFEDVTLPLPYNYDGYLTNQYGNYMRMPPLDERVSHIGFDDLDRPFYYYFDKIDLIKKYFDDLK